MRWVAMTMLLVILIVGLVCFWHGRLSDNAQKAHEGYVLQVGDKYLKPNEDCVLDPIGTDDGWASIEIRADPDLYFFEAEQANGVFESVTKGRATLAASSETARVIKVYRKGETKPFSINLININPRG